MVDVRTLARIAIGWPGDETLFRLRWQPAWRAQAFEE
jgi:hypothetical protein